MITQWLAVPNTGEAIYIRVPIRLHPHTIYFHWIHVIYTFHIHVFQHCRHLNLGDGQYNLCQHRVPILLLFYDLPFLQIADAASCAGEYKNVVEDTFNT